MEKHKLKKDEDTYQLHIGGIKNMVSQDTVESVDIVNLLIQSTEIICNNFDFPYLDPNNCYDVFLQKFLMSKSKKEAVSNN